MSRYLDEPLLYWATDLTPYGVWLETRFPMEMGEVVVVGLRPSVWWRSRELLLFAQVSRVVHSRDASLRGMGLEFLDASAHERRALEAWLRGRPPPLPKRRARTEMSRALPLPRCLAA